MCVGCREMKIKRDLIRVVHTPEDEILLDATGKKAGRGAYICNDLDCLNKAIRSKGLERSLKVKISPEINDELVKRIDNLKDE